MKSRDDLDTRQQIIEVTVDLLRESSAAKVSTRDICRAAGVTAPTLYHYFGDKEGLYHAVAMFGFQSYLAGKETLGRSSDPVEVLFYAWDSHIDFGVTHPSLYALMFGSGRPDRDSPAAVESRAVLAGVLDQIARAGRLSIDVSQATLIVEASMVGTTLEAIRSGYDAAISDHLRDTVLGSILTGTSDFTSDDSLAAVAGQLAAILGDPALKVDSLKPVEIALLREWLRMLAILDPTRSNH